MRQNIPTRHGRHSGPAFASPSTRLVPTLGVMAGLVPAIHVFDHLRQGVDARDERGHEQAFGWRECP